MSFNTNRDQFLENIEHNLAESRRTFQDFEAKFGNDEISNSKWNEILERALNRDHDECSICINKYTLPKVNDFNFYYFQGNGFLVASKILFLSPKNLILNIKYFLLLFIFSS